MVDYDGVSEEYKKKLKELCERINPKDRENNVLW